MNNKQIDKLNDYNDKRLLKYDLLKTFEKENLGKEFKSCLDIGFSSSNPKVKYMNYLRYYFLPFAFKNQISSNELNLLAIQKKEIGLIYYSLYEIAIKIEEVHPRELVDWFMQSYICLEQISDNARKDILFFLEKGLLKKSQIEFVNDILRKYDLYYKGFIGTYNIIKEPYFHFRYLK